jgi:hypothetical protein
MTVTHVSAAPHIATVYCCVHSVSAVRCGMHSFSSQCFKLLNASSETHIPCLICELCSSSVSCNTYLYTHTHTHTHTRRRNYNVLARYFDARHFAGYYTGTALSCVLQYANNRFYIALPQNTAVLRYQNSSVFLKCYVIKHNAFENPKPSPTRSC